ncbi:lysozyme inhibitor LprI family protein [Peteryoungia ipomoeae]|uniref:Lysozyme inhibitor LprI N-terminal domain-containing protein n=1 Tax=Peteryoungia ipomoeae TaxID=1210932 RepID=A0A4S8P7I9_9HYPH|nr:hypothetical protein [Peteryoungia ipomoeae]THV25445.1 hypothetical protein FAA97_04430 [Peteryoungia ipomoeae]
MFERLRHALSAPANALTLSALIGLTLLPTPAGAASFDCSKADLAADEKAICETPALNDMDVRMVTTFELLRELLPMGSRTAMEERQISWLAERKACEGNTDCISTAYAGRIQELKKAVGDVQREQELP